MPLTEKDFGSQNIAAAGLTTLYTVPGATRAIVRTWRVTNRHASTTQIARAIFRPAATDLQYDIAALAPGYMGEFCEAGCVLELEAGDILKIDLSAAISTDVVVTGVEIT
jgi:hypothetical protein